MDRQYLKWILGGAIILALVPVLLYFCKFNSFTLSSNKNDWGTFGDYIGSTLGITLTGITIYLLYMAYMTQNAQLKIQINDSHISYLDLQYNQIIKDINDISFNQKHGSDALHAWTLNNTVDNNVVNTLNFIVHTFNSHIETISSNNNLNEKIKEQFLCRAYLMFHSKIMWPVFSKMYDDPAFKGHTDNLYINFNKLIKETYDYLVPREKLAKATATKVLTLYN